MSSDEKWTVNYVDTKGLGSTIISYSHTLKKRGGGVGEVKTKMGKVRESDKGSGYYSERSFRKWVRLYYTLRGNKDDNIHKREAQQTQQTKITSLFDVNLT